MENKQELAFEMLVGLNVTDNQNYQEYRNQMTPILQTYGGKFGYDFVVEEVLITETNHKINRVFTIRFTTKENKEAFFTDEAYKKVRDKYFKNAVEGSTIIANYLK